MTKVVTRFMLPIVEIVYNGFVCRLQVMNYIGLTFNDKVNLISSTREVSKLVLKKSKCAKLIMCIA